MSNQEQNNSEQTTNRGFLAKIFNQDKDSSSAITKKEESTPDRFQSATSENEDVKSRNPFEQSRQEDPAGLMKQTAQPSSTPRRIEQVDEESSPFAKVKQITQVQNQKNPFEERAKANNNITKSNLSSENPKSDVENLLEKLEMLEIELLQAKEIFLDSYDQIKKSQD